MPTPPSTPTTPPRPTTWTQVFDAVAGTYDQVVPFFAEFGEHLLARVDLRPGHRVLDLGAGRGALTLPAAERWGRPARSLRSTPAPR